MFTEAWAEMAIMLVRNNKKQQQEYNKFDASTFRKVREFVGEGKCYSVCVLTASPYVDDNRKLCYLFLEAMKVKFPNENIMVKGLVNNVPAKTADRIPSKECRVILETYLADQFRDQTGFPNMAEVGIFAVNFMLSQATHDLDVYESTANPGSVAEQKFCNKNGEVKFGEDLANYVMDKYCGQRLDSIITITGYAVDKPTLKTETVGNQMLSLAVPIDPNVNVMKNETVMVTDRKTFDDNENGMFMVLNRLNKDGRPYCWNPSSKTLDLNSMIGQAVQEAVNAIKIQDPTVVRIGLLTTSAKKKGEFEKGLAQAIIAAKVFGMIGKDFDKKIEVFIIKPSKMFEEQNLDSYEVVSKKYMSTRIDYKYLPVLMLLDAIFIEDTIFGVKVLQGGPGTLYQPNSQRYIKASKIQSGVQNYDANYSQEDYDSYNNLVITQTNTALQNNPEAAKDGRSAFAQTLIAATIRTSYGTTITTLYRGFGAGYIPSEPRGKNGFGWDTIMCIEYFLMNNKQIRMDDFYKYLAFVKCFGGDFKREISKDEMDAKMEEMEMKYPVKAKTIAELDPEILHLYKPRFMASVELMAMISRMQMYKEFKQKKILTYNTYSDTELQEMTMKRISFAVTFAEQVKKGNVKVINGEVKSTKAMDPSDLF